MHLLTLVAAGSTYEIVVLVRISAARSGFDFSAAPIAGVHWKVVEHIRRVIYCKKN